MIVSADKVNQLRHTEFFKNKDDVVSHMRKHAELVKPKFEVAFNALDSLNPKIGTVSYTHLTLPTRTLV